MKITSKGVEYPNEGTAIFYQMQRIADALEKLAELKLKEMERG